jgi:cell division protein FtsB
LRYWESPQPKGRRRTSSRGAKPSKRSIASGGSVRQYPFLRRFYQHQAVLSAGIQKFIFFLVLATLLYAFVFGDAGAIHILMLKHERAELKAQVAALDGGMTSLQEQIERLKDDPDMMEKLGRERYGYVYPGDHVYRLVHPPKR